MKEGDPILVIDLKTNKKIYCLFKYFHFLQKEKIGINIGFKENFEDFEEVELFDGIKIKSFWFLKTLTKIKICKNCLITEKFKINKNQKNKYKNYITKIF